MVRVHKCNCRIRCWRHNLLHMHRRTSRSTFVWLSTHHKLSIFQLLTFKLYYRLRQLSTRYINSSYAHFIVITYYISFVLFAVRVLGHTHANVVNLSIWQQDLNMCIKCTYTIWCVTYAIIVYIFKQLKQPWSFA